MNLHLKLKPKHSFNSNGREEQGLNLFKYYHPWTPPKNTE